MVKTIVINQPLSRKLTTCGGVTPMPMSPLEAATIMDSVQLNEEVMRPGELARRNEMFRKGLYHPAMSELTLIAARIVSGGGVIQA